MTNPPPTDDRQPSNFEQQILNRLDKLTADVEQSNERFQKWDSRLWTLTIGLIGTAWAAIFAATAVVIVRALSTR